MALLNQDITQAKHLLKVGNVVAIPTETVYGLAANALEVDAVLKIFAAKKRPLFDPLIVHLPWHDGNFESWVQSVLTRYVTDIPLKALELAQHFWPGPLTLVLKRQACIPDIVTAGLETVGVRVPNHALTQRLLQQLDFPLAAPSANPFGYISPTTAEHVFQQLQHAIPQILDGGPCALGLESTIVGFEEQTPVLLRLGAIEMAAIENVIGKVEQRIQHNSNPKSPGQLKSHYAPKIPLVFHDDLSVDKKAVGCLRFSSFHKDYPQNQQIILSPTQDLNEAAKNLFAAMRLLDAMPIQKILAEKLPEIGLGLAINDRLMRASQ